MKRLVGVLVVVLVLGWSAAAFLLWSFQEAFIFPAPGGIDRVALDGAARELGAEPIDLVASDGVKLYGWYRSAGEGRAVLFLNGNGGVVWGGASYQRFVHQEGWDYATVAYRGYPGSEGEPSEEGLIRDARALWDHVVARGIPPERIVIHGMSLGGGVAAALAMEVRPAAMIIESSYTSVLEIAQSQYPMFPARALLRHPLETRERAPKIDVPVLILHGDGDTTVPVEHGRRLAELYPNARYVEIPGRGHDGDLVVGTPQGRAAWLELMGAIR